MKKAWSIPVPTLLEQEDDKWFINVLSGIHVPINPDIAVRLSESLETAEEANVGERIANSLERIADLLEVATDPDRGMTDALRSIARAVEES